MKKVLITIDSLLSQDHKSNLFPLFLNKFSSKLSLSSSFKDIDKHDLVIFTNINEFIAKKIKGLNNTKYALILDGGIDWSNFFSIASAAQFVVLIGGDGGLGKLDGVKVFSKISLSRPNVVDGNETVLVDEDDVEYLYRNLIEDNFDIKTAWILCKGGGRAIKNSSTLKSRLSQIGVSSTFVNVNPGVIEVLSDSEFPYITRAGVKKGLSIFEPDLDDICIEDFTQYILQSLDSIHSSEKSNEKGDFVNIVCFRPTYLFADLVKRFEAVGCVHSDYPMDGAKSYIWMRPQEIWHYEYLLSGKTHREIPITYQKTFPEQSNINRDLDDLLARSVAIHHGTCYEPLYQFDYEKLALALRRVKSVVGVCEFEECYGPSSKIANRDNFIFVPIGYDGNLFNSNFYKKESLSPGRKLKIGFVGRAYGTNDKKHLETSRLAEPKGYRKGGDILLDVALRLKSAGIPFELHILGQNWEELVSLFSKYKIDHVYYARDKNIKYEDYPSVYGEMDALMITARCEGGPVSAIEALSLGVKVIATNVGVVQYLSGIFSNSGACVSVDYDRKWHITDKEFMVNELIQLYENGRDIKEIMNSIDVVKKFTTDNWVDEIFKAAKSE